MPKNNVLHIVRLPQRTQEKYEIALSMLALALKGDRAEILGFLDSNNIRSPSPKILTERASMTAT
jgi:hypothetical protein